LNTIVILLDTVRRDHVGAYGPTPVKTPALDAFAQRAVRFENAYLGSYPCMPARREIWTGRLEFPWRGWGPLEPGEFNFPAALKAGNKVTQLITDHYHLWERGSGNYHWDFGGVSFIRGQESDNYVTDPNIRIAYPAQPHKLAGHARAGAFERYSRNTHDRKTERDYFAPRVMSNAMDWLDRNHNAEDFCLFIDCFDPHEPWDPPQSYVDLYDPGYEGEQVVWPTYGDAGYMTPEELNHVRALYAGKVTMVDRWLGYLMDHIKQLGLFANTTIVVATDHGCLLGDQNQVGKPWLSNGDPNLYEAISHVPLFVYTPGCKGGTSLPQMVQLVDICPTILDSCGVKAPANLHGRSLLKLARDGEDPEWHREYACFGRFGESANIADGDWVLYKWPSADWQGPLYWHSYQPPTYAKFFTDIGPVVNGRCQVEMPKVTVPSGLYNLKEDPQQLRNLAEERPEQLDRLSGELARFLEGIGCPAEQLERWGLTGYLQQND
jgi:arylsulfatase A-like enzyme